MLFVRSSNKIEVLNGPVFKTGSCKTHSGF